MRRLDYFLQAFLELIDTADCWMFYCEDFVLIDVGVLKCAAGSPSLVSGAVDKALDGTEVEGC